MGQVEDLQINDISLSIHTRCYVSPVVIYYFGDDIHTHGDVMTAQFRTI